MHTSNNLAAPFSTISLKLTLKRILASGLPEWAAQELDNFSDLPLSTLSRHEGIHYTSAIAHLIAAKQSKDVDTLACHLAEKLYQAISEPMEATEKAFFQQLQIEVKPGGWLVLSLSDDAAILWLQQLVKQDSWTLQAIGNMDAAPVPQPSWPLCDRLQISLPVLIHWAWTRCGFWLDSMNESQLAQCGGVGMPTLADQIRNNPAVAPGYELLKELIRALDTLEPQQDDWRTWLRQGYNVSSAFYTFEAKTAIAAVATWPPHSQALLGQILQAVQKALAVILSKAFGTELASSLS